MEGKSVDGLMGLRYLLPSKAAVEVSHPGLSNTYLDTT